MLNDFAKLMQLLEEHYIHEVFDLRENQNIRNVQKLAKLESIARNAEMYHLTKAVRIAKDAILRILNIRF